MLNLNLNSDDSDSVMPLAVCDTTSGPSSGPLNHPVAPEPTNVHLCRCKRGVDDRQQSRLAPQLLLKGEKPEVGPWGKGSAGCLRGDRPCGGSCQLVAAVMGLHTCVGPSDAGP